MSEEKELNINSLINNQYYTPELIKKIIQETINACNEEELSYLRKVVYGKCNEVS